MSYKLNFPEKIEKRVRSGKIIEQKIWKFIRELNSFDDKHLDAIAIQDGYRSYTYRQMFRKWEEYAEVFSALKMTGENGARVGISPGFASESIFALYALNMTGASVSMLFEPDIVEPDFFEKTVEVEGVTDLIIHEKKLTVKKLRNIVKVGKRLGIRNIIVIYCHGKNNFETYNTYINKKERYKKLKQVDGVLFMAELLKKYEAMPIVYGEDKSMDDAIIMHTSGTTNGIHKPIPMSDRGFNEASARLLRCEAFNSFKKRIVTNLDMEPTGAYALIDMISLPFTFGGKVLIIPNGVTNPLAIFLWIKYGINVMFSGVMTFKLYLDMPFLLDFSRIEYLFLGGGYTSVSMKKKINKYLKKCGSKTKASIGYGLTEAGGAVIISDSEREDDAMGYPLPGVKVKIFDEEEEKYYDLADGPRCGVLHIASPSVSCGAFNGRTFFKLVDIDEEKYLNTYDLVEVQEDGSLRYVGRMNKFFVNNEGIKFDAGLIETAVAAEKGIESCGIAPAYSKTVHDTIPALYIKTNASADNRMNVVKKALVNAFIKNAKVRGKNIPKQVVITDNIPINSAGKVDVVRLSKGESKGETYLIKQIKRDGELTDIQLLPYDILTSNMINVPNELESDAKKTVHAVVPIDVGGNNLMCNLISMMFQ